MITHYCINTQLNCIYQRRIDYGEAKLKEIGLHNKKFICVANRDEAYLKENFIKNYDHHSYRNSSIKNYFKALEFLSSENIYSVRMGKTNEEKIDSKNNFIIDYSNSKFKSDFLDLYIPYKCMFWIGGEVGIQMTSKTFRKPIVCVNRVPMFANNLSAGILKKENVTIWKHYYDLNQKKFLSISEIKKRKIGSLQTTEEYKKNKISIIENSSEEIFMATNQLYNMLNGKMIFGKEYYKLEEEFWKLYGLNDYNEYIQLHYVMNICKNKHLMN